MKKYIISICLSLFTLISHAEIEFNQLGKNIKNMELATFGGGCFWCVEAVFENLDGVEKVVSGYAGGHAKKPTYSEVCRGFTGHAEVVQITFDPSKITYTELLEVLFKTHDPTTMNRQGADKGTQYRSIVMYHSKEQQKEAQTYIDKLDDSGTYKHLIVTEVVELKEFYIAEESHQNYYALNKGKQSYCQYVIQPKMDKFEKEFRDKLKNR